MCFECNNTIRSEFKIKIETEKCTIFSISVGRLLSHEKKKKKLRQVAFHDGYANLGKSCHLCINSLPCHTSLIFGSNNDLCKDNYVARCGGRASRNEEDSKISQAVYCKCKPTALQQANCTEKVLENTRT